MRRPVGWCGLAEAEAAEGVRGSAGDGGGDLGLAGVEDAWGDTRGAPGGVVVREARSQGLRGSRLNQCPLLSVRTLSSWSFAWNARCGDGPGEEVGGVFPGLSRGAGRHGTDKEAEAGGGTFVVSLVVTMEGVVATAGSEVL